MIGCVDDFSIVLNDHERIAKIPQPLERLQESAVVAG